MQRVVAVCRLDWMSGRSLSRLARDYQRCFCHLDNRGRDSSFISAMAPGLFAVDAVARLECDYLLYGFRAAHARSRCCRSLPSGHAQIGIEVRPPKPNALRWMSIPAVRTDRAAL